MARPLRISYPGAFYHVTSRGNGQKDIIKSKKDSEKFIEYLESVVKRSSTGSTSLKDRDVLGSYLVWLVHWIKTRAKDFSPILLPASILDKAKTYF